MRLMAYSAYAFRANRQRGLGGLQSSCGQHKYVKHEIWLKSTWGSKDVRIEYALTENISGRRWGFDPFGVFLQPVAFKHFGQSTRFGRFVVAVRPYVGFAIIRS